MQKRTVCICGASERRRLLRSTRAHFSENEGLFGVGRPSATPGSLLLDLGLIDYARNGSY